MYCSLRFSCLFSKQKTAYELRISDWSSDVCSSDLRPRRLLPVPSWPFPCLVPGNATRKRRAPEAGSADQAADEVMQADAPRRLQPFRVEDRLHLSEAGVRILVEIGRASCRERVCKSV